MDTNITINMLNRVDNGEQFSQQQLKILQTQRESELFRDEWEHLPKAQKSAQNQTHVVPTNGNNTKQNVYMLQAHLQAVATKIDNQAIDPKTGLYRRVISKDFMPPKDGAVKVLFLDVDSTLRVSKNGNFIAATADDVLLLPFVSSKIKEYVEDGYLVALVSNQGGIADKYVPVPDGTTEDAYLKTALKVVDDGLKKTIDELRIRGGDAHYMDFAEAKDENRKPNIGMFTRLEKLLKETFGSHVYIDKEQTLMVGDASYKKGEVEPDGQLGIAFSNSDRLFAQNAHIGFSDSCDFFGWREFGQRRFNSNEDVKQFYNKLQVCLPK